MAKSLNCIVELPVLDAMNLAPRIADKYELVAATLIAYSSSSAARRKWTEGLEAQNILLMEG